MNRKKRARRYMRVFAYISAERAEMIRERLGRDPKGKDLSDALFEKLFG